MHALCSPRASSRLLVPDRWRTGDLLIFYFRLSLSLSLCFSLSLLWSVCQSSRDSCSCFVVVVVCVVCDGGGVLWRGVTGLLVADFGLYPPRLLALEQSLALGLLLSSISIACSLTLLARALIYYTSY